MIKIINTATEVFKQCTCKNCATRLEYAPSDVRSYHGRDYSGGPDGKEWINCPCCGKEVILRSW